MQFKFIVLKDLYSIFRFNANSIIPEFVKDSPFYSITGTSDELSIVCKQKEMEVATGSVNTDWKVLKLSGTFDFSLVGIIAEISGILKQSNISIFTISTYDTDYILVKKHQLNLAVESLNTYHHIVTFEE